MLRTLLHTHVFWKRPDDDARLRSAAPSFQKSARMRSVSPCACQTNAENRGACEPSTFKGCPSCDKKGMIEFSVCFEVQEV